MNIKNYIKNNYIVLSVIFIVSVVVSFLFLKDTGIKDGVMIFLSTFLLLLEIFLLKEHKKNSMLLFIIMFPIMVTARKICYFDLLFLKITYETIYITIAFIFNIKSIVSYVKTCIMTQRGLNYTFLIFTIIFVIFGINSSLFSPNILASMSEAYISIVIPVMFFLTAITIFKNNDITKIFYALIMCLDLSCIYGFSQILSNRIPLKQIASNREFLTFGYHNINIFAQILMLIVPIIIDLILYKKNSKNEKVFLYSSFMISLVALLITFTRGAWICFIIAVFIILISKKYRKVIYALLIGSLIVAKPVFSYIISRGTSTSFMGDESVIARIQAIATSFKLIFEYPFGIGGGNFAEMYRKYSDAGYMLLPFDFRSKISVANYAMENAHNLWLETCVNFGIICMIAFLVIVINRMILSLKNFSDSRAMFTSIIIYLIFSVLTGIEFNHKGIITGNLIIWLIFAIIQIKIQRGKQV